MLKFIYVILMNLFRAPYMIPKMRKEADHPEKYSEEERYELARYAIHLMKMTVRSIQRHMAQKTCQKRADI